MAQPLTSKQLLEVILHAIDESGWQYLILNTIKPFKLRLFREEEKGFDIQIYIWNCTHGGGSHRPENEYRVQLTGSVPEIVPGEITLLLGWHTDYGVFVGFDIRKHNKQSSHSPSIQVKEETLQNAHSHAFSIYRRTNKEIAVAFRPEFFVEYALNQETLHNTGKVSNKVMSLLNNVDTIKESDIGTIKSQERKTILAQIARKYRAADFRKRVLGAYGHMCAACGVQLELIDAAHIIPVASPSSTDETNNGIAFCKLHHTAFDRNLFSFNEKYKIEISRSEVARLKAAKRDGGFDDFDRYLRDVILLPNDKRDYPFPNYIKEARKIRHWK